jgi:hypothetical protein
VDRPGGLERGPDEDQGASGQPVAPAHGYRSSLVNYPEIIHGNFDVAIVGKGFDEHHYKNVKLLKQHGKTVYCDVCESLFEFPWFKEILGICDRVIWIDHHHIKMAGPLRKLWRAILYHERKSYQEWLSSRDNY